MKEPSLTDIKLRSEIPVDAKFIGWIIYNPLQDDFLWKFRENARALFKQWVIYPDMALRFKNTSKRLDERRLKAARYRNHSGRVRLWARNSYRQLAISHDK
ncbi:hypothetical protein [Vibrio furnissii]|uniref:hypothetical protein n=1 Tax=Vibrio furnissii TaxID=29494 RepID=UPI0005A53E94|nr:hypothetical protein [Vibrio furnissii]